MRITKLTFSFILFFVGVFVLLSSLVLLYNSQIKQPLGITPDNTIVIKKGASAFGVMNTLMNTSTDPLNPLVAKVWLKLAFTNNTIKHGVYELKPSMNIEEAFSLFELGKQKQFSVTLVEGNTWKQWLNVLGSNEHLHNDWNDEVEQAFLSTVSDYFSHDVPSVEGILMADTYQFTEYTKLSDIVIRAFENMQLSLLRLELEEDTLPHQLASIYEVLVLASIVEKETAVAEERPVIAGVFLNRLDNKMRLQTDPTIIYGLGDEFDGDITREHIRRPTAYNTYVIKGLPPTPIAMIGKEAISAVKNAQQLDYFYFVAKGDGTSYFSTSLEEHNRAVKKYQLGKGNQ